MVGKLNKKVKQMDGKIYWAKNAKILKHSFVSRHEFVSFFEANFDDLPVGFNPHNVCDLYNSKTVMPFEEAHPDCLWCGGKTFLYFVRCAMGRLQCKKCFRCWDADDETQGGYKR